MPDSSGAVRFLVLGPFHVVLGALCAVLAWHAGVSEILPLEVPWNRDGQFIWRTEFFFASTLGYGAYSFFRSPRGGRDLWVGYTCIAVAGVAWWLIGDLRAG